jgi:hypothetical protein
MGFSFKQRANRKYVSSKIIHFIEYDDDARQLKVGFNDGLVGLFDEVPENIITEFENAKSKGNFFYSKLFNAGYKYYVD